MNLRKKINIIITDDNSTFIEGLNLLFSKNQDFSIIETCSNGLELVNSINLNRAHLLLIDIEMPHMNGLNAAKKVNANYPDLPMIAITMYKERVYLLDIVSCGFKAFIHKAEVPQKLFDVIHLVLKNKFVFPYNLPINS